MSSDLPSDEVAEDYKNSLEDLSINSRYEISNLTIIAKENTEHAMAISRVIENHIRTTPPDRKLPALYVLDSVVKNVGTPYTLFLGRNLYKTFMEAYAAVGSTQVRKKLDEMLKTWKESVPGSMDTRPVFPAEVTRPIENDLIRWRTSDLQRQQEQARNQQNLMRPGRPATTPWRDTPTPPQHMTRYQQPPTQGFPILPNGMAQVQQYPQRAVYAPPPQPPSNLDSLHKDIQNLVSHAKSEFLTNVNNSVLRDKLKALVDLQSILTTHQLAPHELEAVRQKVAELSALPASAPYSQPAVSTSTPYLQAPNPTEILNPQNHAPISAPPIHATPTAAPSTQQQSQTDLLTMNSSRLADILASARAQQASSTPSSAPTPLPYNQPSIVPVPASNSSGEPSSLVARLRAAGLLAPGGNTPVNGTMASHPQYPPPHLPSRTPTTPLASLVNPSQRASQNDVELTSASLKKPRPHLIASLYEAFPSQCSTCGKRFLATIEGKKRKERHLDWHFRIRMKREDAAKRVQNRSWYVSELVGFSSDGRRTALTAVQEWIKWQETAEDGDDDMSNGAKAPQLLAAAAAASAQNDPKNQYILVPDDHTLANLPCPICHEPFEKSYDDAISDWVWKDAVKVGSRVYHASEYADMKKDGGNTPLRTATPDSVLGKRKAGVSAPNIFLS
ncbi:MAG: hypothetical protein Q9195_005906 [Heterodermia aff. obscurata]